VQHEYVGLMDLRSIQQTASAHAKALPLYTSIAATW